MERVFAHLIWYHVEWVNSLCLHICSFWVHYTTWKRQRWWLKKLNEQHMDLYFLLETITLKCTVSSVYNGIQ